MTCSYLWFLSVSSVCFPRRSKSCALLPLHSPRCAPSEPDLEKPLRGAAHRKQSERVSRRNRANSPSSPVTRPYVPPCSDTGQKKKHAQPIPGSLVPALSKSLPLERSSHHRDVGEMLLHRSSPGAVSVHVVTRCRCEETVSPAVLSLLLCPHPASPLLLAHSSIGPNLSVRHMGRINPSAAANLSSTLLYWAGNMFCVVLSPHWFEFI